MADFRTKVMSLFHTDTFQSRFPDITLIAEGSVFVPFNMYDVTIPLPKTTQGGLNIFEESVLKLIDAGYDTDLANTLCISEDLAKFILSRLTSLGLLEDGRELTDIGDRYLHGGDESDRIEYVSAKLFALKETLEFIPFVLYGDQNYIEDSDVARESITIRYGTTGTSKKISGTKIFVKDSPSRSLPTQNAMRKVISDYNKICLGRAKPTLNVVKNRMIEVSSPSEVYLHVRVAIQEGGINVLDSMLASEGFVPSNDIIANYINKKKPEIKQELQNSVALSGADNAPAAEKTPANGRYADVYKLLSEMVPIADEANTADEFDEQQRGRLGNIRKLFSALELALAHHLKENQISSSMLATLCKDSQKENSITIRTYALLMGADRKAVPCGLINYLSRSNIKSYNDPASVPTIYTVLPLAIAEGQENGASNMRDAINKVPDFLQSFDDMRKIASSIRHASNDVSRLDDEIYKSLYDKGMSFIYALLPELESGSENNAVRKEKMIAIVSLRQDIGALNYEKLSDSAKTELFKTSSDKSFSRFPIPSEIVLSYCIVAEEIMYDACRELPEGKGISLADTVLLIEQLTRKDCPKGLTRVNEDKYFYPALKNQRASLGGYTMAYIARCSEEDATEFLNKGFAEYINELTDLRKHGNNAGLFLSYEDIKELRKKLYDLIKYFGGNHG